MQGANDWKERVRAERDELQTKVRRLTTLLYLTSQRPTAEVHPQQRALLCEQLKAMSEYLRILNARLEITL